MKPAVIFSSMDKTGEIVRANMRSLRERSRKTKTALSESIGMSRRYWDDVENGNKEPSLSTLERIARALGVSVPDLLTEPGGRPAKRELVRR